MDDLSPEDQKKINEVRAKIVHRYEQNGGRGDIRDDPKRMVGIVLALFDEERRKFPGLIHEGTSKEAADSLHTIFTLSALGRAAAKRMKKHTNIPAEGEEAYCKSCGITHADQNLSCERCGESVTMLPEPRGE